MAPAGRQDSRGGLCPWWLEPTTTVPDLGGEICDRCVYSSMNCLAFRFVGIKVLMVLGGWPGLSVSIEPRRILAPVIREALQGNLGDWHHQSSMNCKISRPSTEI